jgi:hypothetical protein
VEYDFSGKVSPEEFVQRQETEIHRHGLWTVQLVTELNPFDGGARGRRTWDLAGNRRMRVNVYYGTRPLWCSEWEYETWLLAPRTRSAGPPAGAASWERIADDPGAAPREPIPVLDCTGGDAITLWLSNWNGGVNNGHWSQVIRISGEDPATAQVETLFRGREVEIAELDGDPLPEWIVMDKVHRFWLPVVLDWDAARAAYVVANDRLFHDYRRVRDAKNPTWVQEECAWVDSVRREAEKAFAELAGGSESRWGALTSLHLAVAKLVWDGHPDDAKALLDRYPLADFSENEVPGAEPVSKEQWWAEFCARSRKSEYWEGLVEIFPALGRME